VLTSKQKKENLGKSAQGSTCKQLAPISMEKVVLITNLEKLERIQETINIKNRKTGTLDH